MSVSHPAVWAMLAVGTLEGVVMLLRIRSAASGSSLYAGAMAGAVCLLRVAFLAAGVDAFVSSAGAMLDAGIAYVVAAAVSTGTAHWIASGGWRVEVIDRTARSQSRRGRPR